MDATSRWRSRDRDRRARVVTVQAAPECVDANPVRSSFWRMRLDLRSLAARVVPWVVASAVPLTVPFASACRGDATKGTIELRGDVGGLDTLGAQGDSLLERTQRPAMLTDSGIVVLPATPSTDTAAPTTPAGAGLAARDSAAEAITRRALARSDSLAKLDARAGGVGARSDSRAEATDTVRGTLQIRTTDGMREFLLLAQGRRYVLSGVALRGAMALNGLEVMVRGVAITPLDIAVNALVVRGWESLPVLDGVVMADGSLRLTDGTGGSTRPIPPSLRPLVGARVWIAYRDGRPVQFDRLER